MRHISKWVVAALLALGMRVPAQAVVFASTRINNTVTQVTGTKTELVQLLEPQLVLAGWTTISGTGTGDVVMQSADPAGAVPAIRVRLFDTATNCVSISFRNMAASQISNTLFLLPAAAKVWRVIANEYQFFIFHTSSVTPTARNLVAGGIPAVSSFLSPSVIWWGFGDASSDTDTTQRSSFRLSLTAEHSCSPPVVTAQHACNYDGTLLDGNTGAAGPGSLTILSPYIAYSTSTMLAANTFADGSQMVSDAYIGWNITGVLTAAPVRYVGTIYDAIVVPYGTTYDTTITFNGNNYWAFTFSTLTSSCNPNVLALRVP